MITIIPVDSIVCLGCTNSIHGLFNDISGVYGIKVDALKKVIEVSHTDELTKEELLDIFTKRINKQ